MVHTIEKKNKTFVGKVVGVIKEDPLVKPFVSEEESEEEEISRDGVGVDF